MECLNLFDFERLAPQKIDRMVFEYYAGAACDEVTLGENRAAFDRIFLRPRMMVGVEKRDLSTTVLGKIRPLPIMIAPTAFAGMAHPEGELAITRAAGSLGVTTTVSTMSNYAIEEVTGVASAPVWFQLYVYKDRDVTRRLVERAEAADCEALVLTVDTPLIGRREQDIRNRFHLPSQFTAKNFLNSGMEFVTEKEGDSGLAAYIASLWDPGISWKDVAWLESITKLPVIVKGVLRGDDAMKAIDSGAAGIIVSNHGGRQLDTAPATIDVLPEIVEAVGNGGDVLLDSGVRRGTDILKALAYGAKAVLIGRPILWGLGLNGEIGVKAVLALLRDEYDLAMALCGCRSAADITPDLIWQRRA